MKQRVTYRAAVWREISDELETIKQTAKKGVNECEALLYFKVNCYIQFKLKEDLVALG